MSDNKNKTEVSIEELEKSSTAMAKKEKIIRILIAVGAIAATIIVRYYQGI